MQRTLPWEKDMPLDLVSMIFSSLTNRDWQQLLLQKAFREAVFHPEIVIQYLSTSKSLDNIQTFLSLYWKSAKYRNLREVPFKTMNPVSAICFTMARKPSDSHLLNVDCLEKFVKEYQSLVAEKIVKRVELEEIQEEQDEQPQDEKSLLSASLMARMQLIIFALKWPQLRRNNDPEKQQSVLTVLMGVNLLLSSDTVCSHDPRPHQGYVNLSGLDLEALGFSFEHDIDMSLIDLTDSNLVNTRLKINDVKGACIANTQVEVFINKTPEFASETKSDEMATRFLARVTVRVLLQDSEKLAIFLNSMVKPMCGIENLKYRGMWIRELAKFIVQEIRAASHLDDAHRLALLNVALGHQIFHLKDYSPHYFQSVEATHDWVIKNYIEELSRNTLSFKHVR